MSNHPYGLRGDPFASPATLSPKDASRLIRRRVRAFNGDGGVLFPIDTCDLIHELTGGVPDGMLELAGKAMRVAAAEGAPAVLPAHVRKASETAREAGEAVPATASAAEAPEAPRTERAARAIDVLLEAAEDAVDDSAGSPAESVNATAAVDFDDPDLPPFHPAAIALPTRPSENLDAGARDWVSRFIPMAGADPIAGEASHVVDALTRHDVTPEGAPGRAASSVPMPTSPAAMREHLPAALHPPRAHRRRSRPHRPWRRHSGSQGLLIAVAAVCIIAFVVRMSLRGNVVPPGTGHARPTPTSAPAVEPPASAPSPAVRQPAPAVAPPRVARTVHEPVPTRTVPAPTSMSGPAPATVEPARRAAPDAKFGLEVATFIFEERARVERDRLADVGLRARVVTTLEYGSRVYRVVLGGYPHPAAAERAADSLLSNGVVLQARVVRVSFGP